ncbi:response regulator transcription factor [Tepidibacter aestuarii]|uniref:response regulator transcription factor n=1 Tax=Tepidibacter aestuarii TaxID=2925782 RepID=UPI0020BF7AD4|nr:helix-turn-helix domain-containing protein [Tepidibacter aestuarii]CAH2214614.1 two-component system, response regulator YesN [Tepidibacter aestuarii]
MRTAIIADDEELSVELIKYLIKKNDLPIEVIGEAFAGDEALDMINKLKPDIAFIDIRMPILNGLEVIKKIKDLQKQSIDFIVITAYRYFEYAQLSLRLGAKDILLKPIESEQFVESVEKILEYKTSDNQILNQVLEHIHNNYQENIELKKCADKYHTSSSYIARVFKKHCGVTFVTYINNLKIKKARELLKEGELSIKEVAHKVGYNNLNYFYKIFKKNTGVTPNMFKQL